MTIYKSSNWTFIPDSQELIYFDGHSEQLPARLNNCLQTLISSNGSTVSYDELLLKVWGTTHKDASTISSVISEVRKLIGCGKGGKKIIVTVPKRGYRFTLTVDVIEHEELNNISELTEIKQTAPTSELIKEHGQTKAKTINYEVSETNSHKVTGNRELLHNVQHSTKLWITIALILVVIAAIVLVNTTSYFDNSKADDIAGTFVFDGYEVLTHETGREDEFDVSKNGRWLVYVNQAPNITPTLIVKELKTGKKQQLSASDEYYFGSPVFSFDAKQIVFHKQTKEQCEVWIADFSGFSLDASKTKKITNCGKGGFWSTTAFSKDGNYIYFSRAKELTDPYKIYRLDLRTLFERSITVPTSSGRGDYAFSLSPDGQRLVIVRNVLWQESHIIVSDTVEKQSETIIELPYLIARVGWLSNEQLVYCDKNDTIWSYDLISKQQTAIANIDFSCHYPVVASNELYAIKRVSINNAIWSLNKNDGDHFTINPLIDSPYYDFNAMFGPNNSLYFLSNRSGEEKLWQYSDEGFKQYRQVKLPAQARDLEFSVETNSLFGLSEQRLFRYDLSFDEIEWLSKEKHEVFNFSISDDGKLIFSEGNNEYWELKSLDLFTLKITKLNINAFSARQLNGQLYFTKFHEKGLWRKDLQTGQTGQTDKIFDDINIKFNTFWDLWNGEKLIWASDNKFNIFDLKTGDLLSNELTFQGHVGFLKCDATRLMCTFSFRENDESEIVKFKGMM